MSYLIESRTCKLVLAQCVTTTSGRILKPSDDMFMVIWSSSAVKPSAKGEPRRNAHHTGGAEIGGQRRIQLFGKEQRRADGLWSNLCVSCR
ncbi:hypothetical protein CDAR_107281 [Caerostris darwini]|uniref:Uncharacterized protein n=1 Tax=Caerostris darwini TaxID=1538125 RepID=A0AAV4VPN1_9ARAC|nr:hypothetical protein CDAR_107281 [Caerostris darwini]